MKKMFLIIFMSLSLISLSACSEEKSATENATKDADLTGEKFADSAASKIMRYNNGMNRKTANCVVKYITADGQIGLGEVNQMHLISEDMSKNAGRINKAYSAAMQACQ